MNPYTSVVGLGIFFATAVGAGEAEPVPVHRMGVARPRPELAPLVLEADLKSPPMSPLEMAAQGDARPGAGSGADVSGLEVIQSLYGDATAGNQVDLVWIELFRSFNDIQILLDGVPVGRQRALHPADLPGFNGTKVTKVSPGPHTFRVQVDLTHSEASLTVLDLEPFAEPANLQCKSSGFVNPETGWCGMDVSWTISGIEPEFINVWIDRNFQGSIPGGRRKISFVNVPPGPHEVTIRAFKSNSPNTGYGGGFQTSTCDIACEDVPCNSPSILDICQVHYGAEDPGNQVQLQWINGEPYVGGLNAYVDDELVVSGGAGNNLAWLNFLASGDRKIGIEGDCGPDGKSIQEVVFPVLDETPHPNPITGGLACRYEADTRRTFVSWTPADPSGGILAYLTREGGAPQFVGSGFFATPEIFITETLPKDTIGVIFIKMIDGACYGSEVFSCSPASAPHYIQGVCSGEGAAPEISSAIFGLNWLFLGGPTPPCRKACDTDGNGDVNITDMVHLLNFLFLGGFPPSLWGGPSPICSPVNPGDDCEIPNPACPLP